MVLLCSSYSLENMGTGSMPLSASSERQSSSDKNDNRYLTAMIVQVRVTDVPHLRTLHAQSTKPEQIDQTSSSYRT